ncbi:metabotropic glutamate receptor-like protein [Leptotrombidium deliense]|uniref:Metabotropic glutamate receptor-like protein n=1 Tax=Leptotrombidium deliense TaxID=299467 RepID=A0A443SDE6_9ACAR|nr:metabotropic glutamate receptor-like protein [Leptotrombidium deliense]
MAGSEVRFDNSGDGLGRYNIYNYQKVTNADNNTVYVYEKVGNWLEEGLILEKDKIIWNEGNRTPPDSICSYPCSTGLQKIMQQGDTCCWICNECRDFQYLVDEFTCEDCKTAWWPYANRSGCYALPEQYMDWNSYFALVPIAIAVIGIVLTLFVIYTFIKYIETPIVKASGRELSFILLFGILFCYFMTFVLLAKPATIICAFQRFGVGLGFALIYGALLTKTNRISRIFDSARKSARRPSFISPKSQVIITMIMVSIQVVGTVIWFLVEPPGIRVYVPEEKRNEAILKCMVKDSSFLVSLVYNMLLITTCTIYAVKTRKIPENFNESKFIGFTMYTTCIIWLAFVPIYFGTGNSFEVRISIPLNRFNDYKVDLMSAITAIAVIRNSFHEKVKRINENKEKQ